MSPGPLALVSLPSPEYDAALILEQNAQAREQSHSSDDGGHAEEGTEVHDTPPSK